VFDSQRGMGIFLFTTASGTALGPIQPPVQWVPGALSLGVKRPRREGDHSPPYSAEIKNAWSYTSTPQYIFVAWCLVKHRDDLNEYDLKLHTALGYGLDDRGLESRHGVGIFLFTTASRSAVGPTQPPIQWAPGALSPGVKGPGREPDHLPPSSAEVKNACNYTSTPLIRLHGVMLC
jgi:hypothetical protein